MMRKSRDMMGTVLVFFILGCVIAFGFQIFVTEAVFLDELITADTPLWEYQAFIIAVCTVIGMLVSAR